MTNKSKKRRRDLAASLGVSHRVAGSIIEQKRAAVTETAAPHAPDTDDGGASFFQPIVEAIRGAFPGIESNLDLGMHRIIIRVAAHTLIACTPTNAKPEWPVSVLLPEINGERDWWECKTIDDVLTVLRWPQARPSSRSYRRAADEIRDTLENDAKHVWERVERAHPTPEPLVVTVQCRNCKERLHVNFGETVDEVAAMAFANWRRRESGRTPARTLSREMSVRAVPPRCPSAAKRGDQRRGGGRQMKYADADIEIDLFGDFMLEVRAYLTKRGHAPPTDDEKAMFAFFNLQRRLIPPMPRRVHEAAGIACPPALEAGYDEIKRKTIAGEDLEPHLSKRVKHADIESERGKRKALDGLLDDWGIHHLHLGVTLGSDGFVDQHDEILFARFSPGNAFFIGIWTHGNWGEVTVLEEMRRNWPQLVAGFQFDAIPARGQNPTSDEIVRARAAGVQPMIAVGGKLTMPMGGGVTSAKLGVEVVRLADTARQQLDTFQRLAIEQKDAILTDAERRGNTVSRPVKLRLMLDGQQVAFASTEDKSVAVRFGKFL